MTRREPPMPGQIGRFKIESVLGRGGMGEVYKAFDPTLQRIVAVKTVRPDISRPEYLERLYREAQACARLQHPNIVTVFEAGEIDGVVYIAMEYLQGASLSDVLQSGALSFTEKVRALGQVLQALQHAHKSGVIHRDIKPGNVYRLADGTIKLVDFGLARVQHADTLTASGMIVGTPHYASPEQLRGEELDPRTDIYSTGALAYEMFTGRLPFEGREDSISTVILRVISQPPPPMNTPVSRMLPEIEQIVGRAMAKAPAERYQSADDMRVALERFLATSSDTLSRIETEGASTIVVPQAASPSALTTSAPMAHASRTAVTTDMSAVLASSSSRMTWWAVGGATVAAIAAALWLASPTSTPASEPAPSAATAPAVPAPVNTAPATATTSGDGAATPAPGTGAPVAPTPIEPGAKPAAIAAAPPGAPVAPAGGPPAREVGADEMFVAEGRDGSPASTGLKVRLVQKLADGTQMDVPATTTFHTGDQMRFVFESNVDGYLYVVQQGASGRWDVLFPNPDINGGRNAIRRHEQHTIPDDDWFRLDPPPGAEQLFVFLTREKMSQLPGFDRPLTAPVESLRASVVTELQQSVLPRDLVLAKDRKTSASGKTTQATYVVNKSELGKSVSFSLTLKHDK